MTLSESAINEILFALDNGDGTDIVRQLAELGMQDLIEAEATEVIGADKWERTIDRIAHRIDQVMSAVVMEAYVHGVSARSVDKLVAALGVDTGTIEIGGVTNLRSVGRAC